MPGGVILVEQVDQISCLNTIDEFTERMLAALNSMMLDMLAAVVRKDYEDRRRRQAQGVLTSKARRKIQRSPG